MIIQCEHCQAQFRIADEKVPAQGARVNCPNCKNKFVVRPELGIPEPADGGIPSPNDVPSPGYMPSDVAAREAGWLPPNPPTGAGNGNAPFDPFGDEIPVPDESSSPTPAPDDPWGQPSKPAIPGPDPVKTTVSPAQQASTPRAVPPAGTNTQVPPQSWDQGDEPSVDPSVQPWDNPSQPAMPWESISKEMRRKEIGQASAEPQPPEPQPPPQPVAPLPPSPGPDPSTFGPPVSDSGSGLELDTSRQSSVPFEVPGTKPAPAPVRPSADRPATANRPRPRRVAPPRNAFRLILGSFFALTAIGMYGALTDMTFKPSALPFGSASAATPGRGLAVSEPIAEYIDTLPGAPRVFVLQTTVRNVATSARGEIYVGATLYDDRNAVLSKLEAPCGNNFSDDQLRAFKDREDVSKAYSPMGDDLSNKRVDPGGYIRCTIVFFDAPDALALARYELSLTQAKSL